MEGREVVIQERGTITLIAGIVGAAITTVAGIGPYAGYLVGTVIGSVIEGAVLKDPEDQVFTQESFAELKISSSALGQPIPRVYGTNRVAGRYIWASPKIAVLHRERTPSEVEGSKLKGGGGPDTISEFKTYIQHLGVALCEGPILRVTRMWMDETLFFDVAQPDKFILYTADAQGNATTGDTFPVLAKGADHRNSAQTGVLFVGGEDQMPSEFVESFEGPGNVPAYKGVAWILLMNIDLGAFGRVPNFTFEVVQSTQSLGRPVVIRGASVGAWTAWETEVAEGVSGYGSGDLIFYNSTTVNPDIYKLTGGRGVNSMDLLDTHGVLTNGEDETVMIFDKTSGERLYGPIPMNPLDLPSTGIVRTPRTFVEDLNISASSRTISRIETIAGDSFIDEGVVYGSLIQLQGSELGNDGLYTVENVTALEIIVFEPLTADEEDEGFVITLLGHGGTVGLTQAVLGKSYGGDYSDRSFTVGAICAATQDFRFFGVVTEEGGTAFQVERVPLWATPSSVAFNLPEALGGYVEEFYVACQDEGLVHRIDYTSSSSSSHSLSIAHTITFTGGMAAAEAMIIAANFFVYVTESGSNSVWKFQTNADKVQITTNIGIAPQALTEATDGYIWVSNYGERSVSRIDPTTDAVQKFPLPIVPTRIEGGIGGTVWVASESESLILKVSPEGAVLSTLTVPRFPIQMSSDDQGNLWVICDVAKNVVRIDAYGRVGMPEAGNGLACVVRNECERVGILPEEIDVSGLDVQPVSMTIASIVSARTILERLAQAYQFTGIESGFRLRFAFKSNAFNAAYVSQKFLGATTSGEPSPSTLSIVRHDELETPTSVIVTAESRRRSYNADSQSHKISSFREGIHNVVKLDLPLVLDRFEMKRIAQNLLFELLTQRQSYRMNFPPRFLLLEPFDVVNVESAIGAEYTHLARMTEVTLGNNLDMEVNAADYKRHVYAEFRSVPAVSLPSVRLLPRPGIVGADFVEPPYLINGESFLDFPRYLIALYTRQGTYAHSVAFESRNDEVSYEFVLAAGNPAITGTITGTVPTGPVEVWDLVTTIEVTLDDFTLPLAMASELQVLNRSNAAMVGREVIYFTTPTLTAPGVYTLSGLLRGRLGTEQEVAVHEASERFVLLDTYTRESLKAPYPVGRVGVQSHFKTFPSSGSIIYADPVVYTPVGKSIQPWAPAIVSITQNGDLDWTITWLHRSRTESGEWNNNTGISYDPDDTGTYLLTFYDSDGLVTFQTTTAVFSSAESSRTFVYTIADQLSAGIIYNTMDVGIKTLSTRMPGTEARASSTTTVLTGWTEAWAELTMTRTLLFEATFDPPGDWTSWNIYDSVGSSLTRVISTVDPLEGTSSILVTGTFPGRVCFIPSAFIAPPPLTVGVYRVLIEASDTTVALASWRAGIYFMAQVEDVTDDDGYAYFVGVEHSAARSRAFVLLKSNGGVFPGGMDSAAIDLPTSDSAFLAEHTSAFTSAERFSLEVEFRQEVFSPFYGWGVRVIVRKGDLNYENFVDQLDYMDYASPLAESSGAGIGAGLYVENANGTLSVRLDHFQVYSGELVEP